MCYNFKYDTICVENKLDDQKEREKSWFEWITGKHVNEWASPYISFPSHRIPISPIHSKSQNLKRKRCLKFTRLTQEDLKNTWSTWSSCIYSLGMIESLKIYI